MQKQIAMISVHASPLAVLGGVDKSRQNVYLAHLATSLAALGYEIDVFTRRASEQSTLILNWIEGVRIIHVPAGPDRHIRKQDLIDGIDGVAGRTIVPLSKAPTDYELNTAGKMRSEFVAANCFYKLDVLAAVGGFDERFQEAWREDNDLYFTLLEHNRRLVYNPSAVTFHPVRPAQWGVSLRQQRKSLYNALLYKKHPKLYRRRIRITPNWDFIIVTLALFIALGAGLAGHGTLALSAFLVWLALTGRFCVQRLRRTTRTPSHFAEMLVTSALIPPLSMFWYLVGAVKYRVGLL